jgi:hypothetical protein
LHCGKDIMEWGLSDCYTDDEGRHWLDIQTDVDDNSHDLITCPYGQPGDRLWVRELWSPYGTKAMYRADTKPSITEMLKRAGHTGIGSWTPAVQMPRKHSRITLENESVRVERLQDITRGDAMAEGCPFPNMQKGPDPREWFAEDCAYWAANPGVWVVEFRVVEGGDR